MSLETIKVIAIIASSIAAFVTLIFTIISIRRNIKVTGLQIFQNTYSDLQRLSEKVYFEFIETDNLSESNRRKFENWKSLFFNALEYSAFLLNNGFVTKEIYEFYKPTFFIYYEDIFLVCATEEQKSEDLYFQEMKVLYKRLKEPLRGD